MLMFSDGITSVDLASLFSGKHLISLSLAYAVFDGTAEYVR